MTKSNSLHVAIVGCGFTGTTTFYQLVRGYPASKITIFESTGDFGPGFPYQPTESSEYLINNTNDTMCLEPGNRRAFVEWLLDHEKYSVGLDERGHLPRAVYGEFLCDVITHTIRAATLRGIEVELIGQEALDMEEQGDGDVVIHFDGGSVAADMVILATGRCPDVDRFGLQEGGQQGYFPTHMPGMKLDGIPNDAEVYVLGASLSAYDVVNQLYAPHTGCEFVSHSENRLKFVANGNERKIVLCSRSGRLKKIQSRNPAPITRRHFSAQAINALPERGAVLAEVLELMLADARDAGAIIDIDALADPYADCVSAQSLNERAAQILAADIDAAASPPESTANYVVDYLADAQFDIWDLFAQHRLTAEDEALYRSDYESAVLSYAAPCPSITAQRILALMESGRLKVIRGVRSVGKTDDPGFVAIKHEFGTDLARFVINATGSVDRKVRSERQPPLIRNLAHRGLMNPYVRGGDEVEGVAADMSSFRCDGSTNIYAANMFLWGPGFFVSAAIIMAKIVEQLLAEAFGTGR